MLDSYTFQEVHDNTDCIWKFQRYEFIKGYHRRPPIPPPFIILNHLYRILKCRPSETSTDFKKELPQEKEEELLLWEAVMKNKYLLSTKMEGEDNSSPGSVMKRLAQLEEQVMLSAEDLQWIKSSLKSAGLTPEDAPSLGVPLQGDTVDSNPLKEEGFHIMARQLDYPDKPKKIERFPVPDEKVPWEVDFPLYNPPFYTPEDSEHLVAESESEAAKNKNPRGRTGLRGRGVLPHLGANLSLDFILTRWKDKRCSGLEFLALMSGKSWMIPGGEADSADVFFVALEKTMGKTLCQKIKAALSSRTEVTEKKDTLRWHEVSEDTGIISTQRHLLIKVAELHKKTQN